MRPPSQLRLLTVAGVLLVVAAAAQNSASATPSGSQVSVNRTGYAVSSGVAHDVSASWVQPAATCAGPATFADVRVALTRGPKTVQVGTGVDCHRGRAFGYAWMKYHGGRQKLGQIVKPGDHISAEATSLNGISQLSITDSTQGWAESTIGEHTKVVFTTASVLVAARSSKTGVLPLTRFGTVRFSHCKMNRHPLAGEDSTRITMQSPGGTRMARPSRLTPPGSFTVTWLHG